MAITKLGSGLLFDLGALLGRKVKQKAPGAIRAAYSGAKQVGRGVGQVGKGVWKGNQAFGRAMVRNKTLRNAMLPALVTAGLGGYSLPRKVKANMVHVNPESENFTHMGWHGLDFRTPQMREAARNTKMIY